MPFTLKRLLEEPIRVIHKVAMTANMMGTLVVLILVAIVNYDMLARSIFGSPFPGTVEVVQFSLVFIVFLQLPDVVFSDRLTRSDGFLNVLQMRAPRYASFLGRSIDLLSAIFMGLVSVAVWPDFVQMWLTNDYFGVPGIFTAPWWPVKLIIVLSSALCSLIFFLKVIVPKTNSHAADASSRETSA
jgi:TRAP-type C4-dicarboxylate transport system permease small subunit